MESFNWTAFAEKGVKLAGEYLSKIFDGAFSAIGSVTSGIINGFLGICFAFYALARKEVLARQCRRLVYSLIPEKWADELIRIMRLTNVTFSNFISGQCLEACILGCMFAVVMTVMGLPYIPLVSVIIAVTALVPLVGAFAGCILGALFILVESPVQALTFVIVFLILQQIEGNLIYPKVVGTSIGLPGMWVLVALTVGGELAGVMGMLVMIPLASVVYALLREFTNARVAERNIPAEKLRDHPPELKSKFKEKRERKREQQLLRRMKELAEKHAPDKGKKK
jgi:predicted PurR-regulated permease PerM